MDIVYDHALSNLDYEGACCAVSQPKRHSLDACFTWKLHLFFTTIKRCSMP